MDFTKGCEAPEKDPVEDTEGNPPVDDHKGCEKETWNKDVWGREEDANTDWRNKETEMARARGGVRSQGLQPRCQPN
ncbi:hypothetical protein AOXY_G10872 [Acipenser oxyrinchus oxyrinchus]|uniref:Uncharacterized protein n=1 Tax=Acipenser oxyrinchus oxyrinchus TaxID=40147 RepID=A0AAD8DE41_ACIOX|nr:hypothetical protein AOXY_G10872 [Acipenser oxyrinchus oxyrinchus]